MKRILLFVFVSVSFSCVYAQSPMGRVYEYDAAGNRVVRMTVDFKSKSISNKDSTETNDNKDAYYVDEIGNMNVRVYPNPTTGKIFIRVENTRDFITGTLVLYSTDGKLLKKYTMNGTEQEVDLSEYVKGIYILKVRLNEHDQEWKIIKQ